MYPGAVRVCTQVPPKCMYPVTSRVCTWVPPEYVPGYLQSMYLGTSKVCARVLPECVPGYPQSMYLGISYTRLPREYQGTPRGCTRIPPEYVPKHTLETVSQVGDSASHGFSEPGPQLQSSIHLSRAKAKTEQRKNKKRGLVVTDGRGLIDAKRDMQNRDAMLVRIYL